MLKLARAVAAVLCVSGLWAAGPSAADEGVLRPSPATLVDLPCSAEQRVDGWEEIDADDNEIGAIHFQVGDIFDPTQPSENRWSFRTVNRLHRTTRPWVIEEQLLFASGERLDRRVVEETERRLRSLGFLYDATILPVCRRGGRVDLLVITRDVWTLGVKLSFRREGGENTLEAGLSDDSFLGTGRPVSLLYISDPDRDAYELRYFDPSLFGRNRSFRLKIEERSDGHRRTLAVGQPFYALDTRRSLTAGLVDDRRTDRLYSRGEVVQEFDHSNRVGEVRFGMSGGLRDGRVRRLSFGYTYQEDLFEESPTSLSRKTPESRTLSYPWVEVRWLEDGYVEAENLDRIGRTEDVNLGLYAGARLGVSLPAFGGDRSRAVVRTWFGHGWRPSERRMLFLGTNLSGRWGEDGEENVLAGVGLAHYWRNWGLHQLYTGIRLDAGWSMDGELQFLLGGDTGLRGYSRNFLDGDRRALVSLEQRFYSKVEIADLVNVGAAVFLDAGSAWYAADPGTPDVFTNVGVGLRLSSTRSAQGGMVHLDVAFPLNGDADGIQFLVRSRETF